jgi:hypothetical protein
MRDWREARKERKYVDQICTLLTKVFLFSRYRHCIERSFPDCAQEDPLEIR